MNKGLERNPRKRNLKPIHQTERLFLLRRKGPFSLILEGTKEKCLKYKLYLNRLQSPRT